MIFNSHKTTKNAGYLLVLVLIFGSVFFVIMSSFMGFLLTQSRVVEQRIKLDQSAEIAEAGLNYYRWFLAHNPADITNGSGLPGPYVLPYRDPETGPIGEYSLEVTSTSYCDVVSSIRVTSTGSTYADPSVSRTITARYMQPTVAEYAFIINASVWAGPSLSIIGPYHSNQGIRMDGTNQSTVTSGQSSWNCNSSFGCNPAGSRPGVFTTTSNPNQSLFSFPSPPINFTSLSIDLAEMQSRAQNNGGRYFGPSGTQGYSITFNSNGTYNVHRVTDTYSYTAYSLEDGDFTERNIIRSSSNIGTFTLNPNCPLIFVADKLWLQGVINGKVTIAAAGTDSFGNDPSIILQGNITYSNPETNGLLAIAEDNVLLGVDVPNILNLNGIFVAQKGRFGRNLYTHARLPDPSGPLNFKPYYERDILNMVGTVVSNGRVGTRWVGGGGFVSGFHNRYNSYDRNLLDDPPPLVPNTSDVYSFVNWSELE